MLVALQPPLVSSNSRACNTCGRTLRCQPNSCFGPVQSPRNPPRSPLPFLPPRVVSTSVLLASSPAASPLMLLQVYLSDSRSTDAVYDGLVSRACAEPLR